MGLGISGRAAVRYALACGAEVIVSDLRSKERFFAEEAEFLSQVSVEWEAGRITSYNVCYTKLLRLPRTEAGRSDGSPEARSSPPLRVR